MLPASVRVADNMVQMFFDGDVTDVSDWVFEFDLIMPKDSFESICSSMKVDGCTLITTGVYFKAALARQLSDDGECCTEDLGMGY